MSFEDFPAFLLGNGIKHFDAQELCPVGKTVWKNGKTATLEAPPVKLWENIIPTLKVLEWLRAETGDPIFINSGYRDPQYNAVVGGESESLHMAFNACDIHAAQSPKVIAKKLLTHPQAAKLGIGCYDGFTHVDSRGMIGRPAPARWSGKGVARWWP